MLSFGRVLFTLAAATLSAIPVHAIDQSAERPEGAPIYYLFTAKSIGYPTGRVSARFEYRTGDRVLGTDEVLLHFAKSATLLVPLPQSPWLPSSHHQVRDLRIFVYADGVLLNVFDRPALSAYSRILQFTHPEELPAAAAGRPMSVSADKILCNSPCGGGCSPSQDYDCDGVNNANDNCTDDPNAGQQDCDSDGYGDACDVIDGIFQPTGPVKTCMTDKDDHVVYRIFEHHVEQRLIDVSSCGSPDSWNRWVRSEAYCYNLDDGFCCEGLSSSIEQVGDDPSLWCGSSHRNIDFCH